MAFYPCDSKYIPPRNYVRFNVAASCIAPRIYNSSESRYWSAAAGLSLSYTVTVNLETGTVSYSATPHATRQGYPPENNLNGMKQNSVYNMYQQASFTISSIVVGE